MGGAGEIHTHWGHGREAWSWLPDVPLASATAEGEIRPSDWRQTIAGKRRPREASCPATFPLHVPSVLDFSTGMRGLKPLAAPHLEEGHHPKRGLYRLHLGVLCQQHVLDS